MESTNHGAGVRRWFTRARDGDLMPPFYLWLGIVLLTLFTLGPFVYLLTSSLSLTRDLLSGHLLPHSPTWLNYRHLLAGTVGSDFFHALRNSFTVSAVTTLLTIVVGTLGGYALARLKFPLRVTLLFIILAMQLLPSISIIVPLYVMMRDGIDFTIPFTGIGWHTPPLLDTNAALIAANLSFSLPYAAWLLSGYLQGVSRELEEAAYIDGCGKLGTMARILVPLAMPGIAATAIFTFLNCWDEFIYANAFTQTVASKTLPIVVREFIGKHSIDWGLMTAGGVVASLPPVIISLVLYRYIVSGLSAGGVKE